MNRLLACGCAAVLFAGVACGDPPGGDDDDDVAMCMDGDPVLACADDVQAACTSDVTALSVDDPLVCGEGVSVTNDAPANGYPVGETTVTFTATGDGVDESCTVTVTVTDDTDPVIDCPENQQVVRTAEGETVDVPEATATDDCSTTVDVVSDPTTLDQGVTDVEYTATDAAGNTATCTTTITIIDVFAVKDLRIVSSAINGAGATDVTLGWDLPNAADATGYRIERAADPAGPYTELATVGTTEQLYTDTLPGTNAYYRVVTVADDLDGGTTDPLRAFAVATELYDIRDVPVPGIPFDTTLYGVVRYPQDLGEGPFPLVVVLHGNHGNCRSTPEGPSDFCSTTEDHDCTSAGDFTTPNAEGYIYFLETLASQGYIMVSISGNAMNCRNDFIIERANLIAEHLRHWADWQTSSDGPFGTLFNGRLDLAHTGLVGHSRGGDAVSNVPGVLAPSPVAGLTIESIFAIAPTDFHNVTVPEADLAVLLPSCDGDVSNLTGMDHYDRSIPLDDGARRAQVLYVGAIHNYFNTEWKNSDNGGGFSCSPSTEVGQQGQTGMLETTLGAWFAATLKDQPMEAYIRAEAEPPTVMDLWAGLDMDQRWSFSSSRRLLVDDFQGSGTPDVNDFGETNTFNSDWHELTSQCVETGCSSSFLHEKGALRLLWEQGGTPTVDFHFGGYDASGYAMLSFRVVSRRSSLNSGLEIQDYKIRVYDTGGDMVELLLSDYKELRDHYPATSFRPAKDILQTIRLPLDDLVALNPDLDLTALDYLQFEMTALDRSGSVAVTEFELAD
jgi:hypothetical protein